MPVGDLFQDWCLSCDQNNSFKADISNC